MNYCFSTEAVDLNNQAPNRNKRESKYFWDELNLLIAAGGFDRIEIPYEPKWDFGGRSGIPRTARSVTTKFGTVSNYTEYLKKNGIKEISSVHFDPSLFCRGMLPMYFGAAGHFGEEAVRFASEAGCPVVTISATPAIFAVKQILGEESEAEFLNKTEELLKTLLALAEKSGITLCLKNEYWGFLRGEGVSEFLDRFHGALKLDLDTAHLSVAGADIASVIERNKDRIGIVHLTDTAFTDTEEAYLTALPEFPPKAATKVFVDPGEGKVKLKDIEGSLKKAGYDGMFVFNTRNSYDVYRSILRTRSFIDRVMEGGEG